MQEIELQLGNGKLPVRAETTEEAQALAQMLTALWPECSAEEQARLQAVVQEAAPLIYRTENEAGFRRLKTNRLFARKDRRGTYHVFMQDQPEETMEEARAIRILKRKRIDALQKQTTPRSRRVGDAEPGDTEKLAAQMLKLIDRQLQPLIRRIERLEKNSKEE